MDINKQPYKHLKLDKFVYGSKQKIIKTTTQVLDFDEDKRTITNYQGNKKNVYYFSDINNNLIDFHQINFDYINNKKSKLSLKQYNDAYNPYFMEEANKVKNATTEQDGQRITYFPQYIYTPLDITQFKNSCYLLLPMSTNKFVNIAHPNKILTDVQSFNQKPISIKISSNINPHLQFYDKPAYSPEDNSIPVYDMNFAQLKTIKFPSLSELYIWLLKWGLQNVLYQTTYKIKDQEVTDYHSLINEILFDSTKNMSFEELVKNNFSTDGCDSILLEPFINYITSRHYLYSKDTMNKMLSELFSVISTTSTERYFKLVGKINNLNEKLYEPLSKELNVQGIYNTKDMIYRQQDVTFDPVVLPQNTLLIDSIQDSLEYDKTKEEVEYLPSCYINYVNLKNNRDPQYQLNCTIDNIKISNDIFTTNYRFSIQNNNYFKSKNYLSTVNEEMTLQIVDKAIQYDEEAVSNQVSILGRNYNQAFPQRMSIKKQYYLKQYDNKHICDNIMYNMGTLDGIRNYSQAGTSFNNIIWLSYNYNEENQNNIIIYIDEYTFQIGDDKYNLKYTTDDNDYITDFYFVQDNVRYYIKYSDIISAFYPQRYDDKTQIIKTVDDEIKYVKIKSEKQKMYEDEDGYFYYNFEDGEKIYLRLNKNILFSFENQYFVFDSNSIDDSISAFNNYFSNNADVYYIDVEFIDKLIFNGTSVDENYNAKVMKNGIITITFNNRWKENGEKILKNDIQFERNNYKIFELPFHSYSLNRDQHWIKDYNGMNLSSCVMKSYGIECPWNSPDSILNIQNDIIGCPLDIASQCNGFCTFPCNGQNKKSNNNNLGFNWKLSQYYELFKGLEDVKQKMNNGLDLSINNEWFIIPATNFNQLIIVDKDVSINDDLQVFITSSNIDIRSQFNDFVENITPQQELKSIFQGFWNKGQYKEYRYTSDKYQIAPNSKFNGPHIITKDTMITCYDIETGKTYKYIPAGYYCLMRVKSWWSDVIRCEGTFKVIQNIQQNIDVSNYDFIQTVDGFFKFKQSGLHKSNIYSINLKNTGLSKLEDKEVKYYTKEETIALLQKKYFIKYYKDEDSFLVNNEQNTFIEAVFNSTDNTTFKRTPLFKNIENTDYNGFVLNYVTIPFNKLVKYQGLSTLTNEQFEEVYYYAEQLKEATEYNETRQSIRQLIEQAIRKSIIRYMPADTDLWKVEFKD